MSESSIIKVWSWRQAIAKNPIPPTTKLVLYTLANYMNEHGSGCYPSIETIGLESGLSKRAVITHVDKAVELGFLRRSKHGYGGQKWARNEYHPCFPKGSELGASPSKKGGAGGALPHDEGGAPNSKKAVQEVHTNSPMNTPVVDDDKAQVLDQKKSIQEIHQWLQDVHFKPPHIFYITAPISAWLEWGADFELDIKPVAERFKARKPNDPPRSLTWLDGDIAKSIEQRNKPRPVTTGNQASGGGYVNEVANKQEAIADLAKIRMQEMLNQEGE